MTPGLCPAGAAELGRSCAVEEAGPQSSVVSLPGRWARVRLAEPLSPCLSVTWASWWGCCSLPRQLLQPHLGGGLNCPCWAAVPCVPSWVGCICGCGRGRCSSQTQDSGRAQEAAGSGGARPALSEAMRSNLLQQRAAVVALCSDGRQSPGLSLRCFLRPCGALSGRGSPGYEVNWRHKGLAWEALRKTRKRALREGGNAYSGPWGPRAASLSQGTSQHHTPEATLPAGWPWAGLWELGLGSFLFSLIGMVTASEISPRHRGLC